MPVKISSTANERIKKVVQLRDRQGRDKSGLTIVEGSREVGLALTAGVQVDGIFLCSELLESKASRQSLPKLNAYQNKIYDVPEKVYAKMSYGERHEGVLAVVRPVLYKFSDLKKKDNGLYVVVESVEKPGNLGAILRSCDAAGVDALIVCDGKTDLYNPNVIRGSLGTVFTVKVLSAAGRETVDFFKTNKIKIYAATPAAQTVYTQADFKGPAAIAVGSEEEGLSEFLMKAADVKIKIPMHGKIDSLNVSASTAVLLYEVIRQRQR